MKFLLPKGLVEAGRMLHSMVTPVRTARSRDARSGWPAPSDMPTARHRSGNASWWSPRGPAGDWKRRSLDRFGGDRRG